MDNFDPNEAAALHFTRDFNQFAINIYHGRNGHYWHDRNYVIDLNDL